MNTFCKHYQNSIKLSYHRLGHILLNGLIGPSSNLRGSSLMPIAIDRTHSKADV